MMVTLNSRLNISSKKDSGSTDYSTSSNSEMRRRLPNESSHGEITVTQEQWTIPPVSEVNNSKNNLNVSIWFNPIRSSFLRLILIWGWIIGY